MKLKTFSLSRRAMLQGSAAGAASLMLLPTAQSALASGTVAGGSWQTQPDLLPPRALHAKEQCEENQDAPG